MPDETIKRILLELGLYSMGVAYVGSEAELFRMFKDDFGALMRIARKE